MGKAGIYRRDITEGSCLAPCRYHRQRQKVNKTLANGEQNLNAAIAACQLLLSNKKQKWHPANNKKQSGALL